MTTSTPASSFGPVAADGPAPKLGLHVTVQSADGDRRTYTTGEVSWLEPDGSFVLACGDIGSPDADLVGFSPGTGWTLADSP